MCLPPPLRGIGSATPALRTLPCNTTLFYEQALEVHAVGSSVPGQTARRWHGTPLGKTDARLKVAPSRVGASLRSMNSDSFSHG